MWKWYADGEPCRTGDRLKTVVAGGNTMKALREQAVSISRSRRGAAQRLGVTKIGIVGNEQFI